MNPEVRHAIFAVLVCAGAGNALAAESDPKAIATADKVMTALGGDNRTGCAVLVNLIATLLKNHLPHPPLTFLFTVREESGLFGARHIDPEVLQKPTMGFNFDGRSASDIIIGAAVGTGVGLLVPRAHMSDRSDVTLAPAEWIAIGGGLVVGSVASLLLPAFRSDATTATPDVSLMPSFTDKSAGIIASGRF